MVCLDNVFVSWWGGSVEMMYIVVYACVFCLWMCPRCGVYTRSSGLISQWVDHMTSVVSWAYSILEGTGTSGLDFYS